MLARITLLGAYTYGLHTHNAPILWATAAIAAALAIKADHEWRNR